MISPNIAGMIQPRFRLKKGRNFSANPTALSRWNRICICSGSVLKKSNRDAAQVKAIQSSTKMYSIDAYDCSNSERAHCSIYSTAIYVTTKLAPHLLGSIAIAAYSYMALVPIIQPPIMKVGFPTSSGKSAL